MGRHKAILFGITMLAAGGARQADAQTFRTCHCADGTQFIVGFYDYEKRGFLQRRSGIKKGRNFVVSTLFQTSAERLKERGGLRPDTGISVPIWALLRRPRPGGTSYRYRSRRSREAKRDRREGGYRHSGVPREPRGPRLGIGRSSQIRDSDHYSSLRLLLGRSDMASMVRPTRSIVVTGIPISASRSELESAEKEISVRSICRHSTVCIP